MKRTTIALALAAIFAASRATAAAYTDGHGDFGVTYGGGQLHFHFHAGGATVGGIERDGEEFALAEIVTVASTNAMRTLSSGFPALGAGAGDVIWVLPEAQDLTLPFLGLSASGLNPAQWGGIEFSLVAVSSPSGNGHFALWQSGGLGDLLLRMSTADPAADVATMQPGNHAHYNWGFTEPGIWQIEMTVSGTHNVDGFRSTSGTLVFDVVPEPSVFLLGGIGLVGLAAFRRR